LRQKVVQVTKCPDPAAQPGDAGGVESALNLLERAERPLVLVGKGMACRAPRMRSAPLSSARKYVPAVADG